MRKVTAAFDRWLSRTSAAYSFWPLIPSGLIAILTAYISTSINSISQFGLFGWWSAGLIAFFLASVSFMALGLGREKMALARATANWPITTGYVNPLRTHFSAERLVIRDLAHPVTNKIVAKTFTDCELFGPANIVLTGGGSANGVAFLNCEFLVVKDKVFTSNVLILENCHLIGGSLWNAVVFMSQEFFDKMRVDMPNLQTLTYERP